MLDWNSGQVVQRDRDIEGQRSAPSLEVPQLIRVTLEPRPDIHVLDRRILRLAPPPEGRHAGET